MRLAFHGGMCCGIKTIYEMGHPDRMDSPLEKCVDVTSHDIRYNQTTTQTRFYPDAAPAERNRDRLDRYIDFCKKKRPAHMIEITLSSDFGQVRVWGPILEERGFKKVTEFVNSNSGAKVSVWHLVYEFRNIQQQENKITVADAVEAV